MPHLTRRRFITLTAAWAAVRASGFRLTELERALAAAPVTLDHVPIYLTFDDGVETEGAQGQRGPTLDVLDILEQRRTRATFFLHGINTGVAEGAVVARMLTSGHRVGNHLFQQVGATLADAPSPADMVKSYLDTEFRIREVLQDHPAAASIYTAESYPNLFRRPGGGYDSGQGNRFLLPDGGWWEVFPYDDDLALYRHRLDWLRGVYDYSGWHVSTIPLWANTDDPLQLVDWVLGGALGVDQYLAPLEDDPAATTQAALDGLIILLHDPDPRTVAMLPLLLDALDERGAVYHVLPRPVDAPNTYTVGIDRPLQIMRPGAEA